MSKFRTATIEEKFFDIGKKPINPSMKDLTENYKKFRLGRAKSPHTMISALKRIHDEFGDRFARDITQEEVGLWLSELRSKYEVSTIKATRNFMSAEFNTWNKSHNDPSEKIVNPVSHVKGLGSGNKRNYHCSEEKFAQYLLVAYEIDECFGTFWQGGYECGGRRPMEVAEYDWNDIPDLEQKRIYVRDQITKTLTDDYIEISPWLYSRLSATPKSARKGKIFKTKTGKKWLAGSWRRHTIELRIRVKDPKIWFRDTRRIFTTARGEEGIPAKQIMACTGQKDINTFMRYHSVSDEKKRTIINECSNSLLTLLSRLKNNPGEGDNGNGTNVLRVA
jgi:hypothetical protein